MTDIAWTGLELWREDFFDEMAPHMPPVVRWEYSTSDKWRSNWVAFRFHPDHLVLEHWDGYDYAPCRKCGVLHTKGMVEARTPEWLSAKDIVRPISKALLVGLYATDFGKQLPCWKLAGKTRFTPTEVRD